jgi:elongation factor Ts
MAVTAQMVKELRKSRGRPLDCKKALEAHDGDMDKAAAALREKGLAAAAKKAERQASEGRVEAYIHHGDKLGVLLEVNCETDFVARTPQFVELCHDVAMQVAAAAPQWVSRDEVPADVLAELQSQFKAEVADQKKPENIVQRIVDGKLEKFYQENCLLDQAFIRDDSKTIQQLLTAAIAALGENIIIRRFTRYQIG